jgi:hypothetical protein
VGSDYSHSIVSGTCKLLTNRAFFGAYAKLALISTAKYFRLRAIDCDRCRNFAHVFPSNFAQAIRPQGRNPRRRRENMHLHMSRSDVRSKLIIVPSKAPPVDDTFPHATRLVGTNSVTLTVITIRWS